MMNVKQHNSSKLINFTIESLSDNLNNLIGPDAYYSANCYDCGAPDPEPCECDVRLCPASVGTTPNWYTH